MEENMGPKIQILFLHCYFCCWIFHVSYVGSVEEWHRLWMDYAKFCQLPFTLMSLIFERLQSICMSNSTGLTRRWMLSDDYIISPYDVIGLHVSLPSVLFLSTISVGTPGVSRALSGNIQRTWDPVISQLRSAGENEQHFRGYNIWQWWN
jgi:hypothetical protein